MTATDNRRYFFTYSIILGFCMLFVAVFFGVGDRQNWMMLGLGALFLALGFSGVL
ncbi:hypothetical protein BH18ACT10_BH18ACT10_09830 [soil metagenome]